MSKLRKRLRRGFKGCLIWMVFAMLFLRYGNLFPIQFADARLGSEYRLALLLSVPTSIMLGALLDFLINRSNRHSALQALMATLISIFFFFISFMAFFIGGDRWEDERKIFEARFSDHEIVKQSIAFSRNTRVVKIKPLGMGFRLILPTDTTLLDPYEWEKVPPNQQQLPW